ncbi:AbrB/MazE/SpoVT family DNA-binding domain-containing protein [Antarcticirhabdus aurantiaca]|uniref:AbrB/MazE/SpoVT family DNA-binding domain-containing protein n=1 Tax=Antarcticirhabdus aurantiaca TaxID=2606717 RepID=A0ACD4NJY9_9HYPH|nr:AbrB/MazE/SpoVT family DNA-binding domain-containing protein [Antarcticirhabdus aurantiaca]WAJ27079.1 AbrB/MazE/SpoVT family DNA-binding domain-containing protein [Jeongeuplla avenae]
MRLTEKSQVTIPKPIRDKLGIGPGSEVEFVDRGDLVELVRKPPAESAGERRRRLEEHLQAVAGTMDFAGLSPDEAMSDLRGRRDDLDPR